MPDQSYYPLTPQAFFKSRDTVKLFGRERGSDTEATHKRKARKHSGE